MYYGFVGKMNKNRTHNMYCNNIMHMYIYIHKYIYVCLICQKCIIDGILSCCVQRPAFQKNMETWFSNSFSQWGFKMAGMFPIDPFSFIKESWKGRTTNPHHPFTMGSLLPTQSNHGPAGHSKPWLLGPVAITLVFAICEACQKIHRGSKSWLGVAGLPVFWE